MRNAAAARLADGLVRELITRPPDFFSPGHSANQDVKCFTLGQRLPERLDFHSSFLEGDRNADLVGPCRLKLIAQIFVGVGEFRFVGTDRFQFVREPDKIVLQLGDPPARRRQGSAFIG